MKMLWYGYKHFHGLFYLHIYFTTYFKYEDVIYTVGWPVIGTDPSIYKRLYGYITKLGIML